MRLLVHMGGLRTACSAVQAGLVANTELLRDAGVLVPMTGRASVGKKRVAHDLLAPSAADDEVAVSATWRELAGELSGATVGAAFVSSALLEASARDKATRPLLDAGLSTLLDAGIQVTVLYVVRDQLTQLNGQYVDRVAALAEAQSFVSFCRPVVRSGELNLHQVFSPWYAGPPQFVAVPYPAVVSDDPLTHLLRASHVDIPEDRIQATRLERPPRLGPLGVEAMRLLGQHLRAIDPTFDPASPVAGQVAKLAIQRAKAAGWADDGYWGWSPDQAGHAAARLRVPNQTFAEAVWKSAWPLPMPVDREETATTLLRSAVPEVSEVQRYTSTLVRNYLEIRSGRGPTKPRPQRTAEHRPTATGDSKAATRRETQPGKVLS